MEQILDLHIHSKYSRACSPQLTLPNIEQTCRTKGVDIIATGDFTYPAWFKHIKEELEEIKSIGLFQLKKSDGRIKFILSTELSLVYKDDIKCRRIHLVLHAPSLEAVTQLNDFLDKHYNIRSDGRPILGMTAPALVKLCLDINPRFLIYPAHIWTPWYSVFGSKSGFDTLAECFQEQTKNIYAIETGLSSDPAMNWRLSALDNLTILSNSDAHSLANIGREANIFDMATVTYDEVYRLITSQDKKQIIQTIEFYPEEGMYHYDGHRHCQISFEPTETRKHKGLCPVCKKPLVIGVMNRVEELADRPLNTQSPQAVPFIKLVELDKIIAQSLGIKSRQSKQVAVIYNQMIKNLGSELHILRKADLKDIKQIAGDKIALGISHVRQGQLQIQPGFDGQYGQINIFSNAEQAINQQIKLL
ncbi:MAG: endonuclease Q family protein [bacterium]